MSPRAATMLLVVGLGACSASTPQGAVADTGVALPDTASSSDGDVAAPPDAASGDEVIAPASCPVAQTLVCDRSLDVDLAAATAPATRCGTGAPGVVYRFSAAAASQVTVTVSASIGAPEVSAVGASCDDSALCDASTDGSLAFAVAAGDTRDLVVTPGGAGAVHLAVACCVPSCAGRVCGDDGCGGSCGACGAGTVCDGGAGACITAQCVPAATLGCGDSLKGVASDGPGHTNAVPGNGCNGFDYSGPEMAYLFESTFTGALVARLPQYDANEELDVFILEDGGDGLCDASRCLASGLSLASAPVEAGKRYYVLVDGYQGNVSPFDLSLECCTPDCAGKTCGDDGCGGSCGTCADGTYCPPDGGQCVNPVCTPSAALACGSSVSAASNGPGSTDVLFTTGCAAGQDYSGPEQVYSFSSPKDATVTFSMPTYDAQEDLDLFLLKDKGGQCLLSECVTFGFQGITTDVKAGQTYYLVVDGYKGNESPFNLTVKCCTPSCDGKVCGSDGCGGSCGTCPGGAVCTFDGSACATGGYVGNDTCASAFVVEALPFETQVDTREAADDYTMGGKPGCVEQYEGGPDVVYAWTADAAGTLVVTVVPAPDTDESCSPVASDPSCSPKVAYVSAGCPDAAGACLDAVDLYQAPNKTLVVKNVVAGTTYYVVVDGFDSTEAGVAAVHMALQE